MHVVPFPLPPRPAPVFGLASVVAALLVTGCASTYQFTVDAVRPDDLQAHGTSYRLVVSEAAQADPATLHVAEQILRDIRTALSSKGLFEAPEGTTASLVVDVDFGLEGPEQRVLTYNEPVYLNVAAGSRDVRSDGRRGGGANALPTKVGERTVTRTEAVYRKFLRLSARPVHTGLDGSSAPTTRAVWSILVTNEDDSTDLARYARLMTAAAMDLIGRDTPEARQVVLTDGDGRVIFIERGLGA